MRRALKWIAAVIIGVPVLLIVLVLIAANVGPGRTLIAGQVGSLTGGMVSVQGIAGRFPDALRIRRIEIRDAQGVWLAIDDAALDWSPLRLLGGTASIQSLTAARVDVERLPVASAPSTPVAKGGGGFSLPVKVDVRRLAVAALDVGAPVAGHALALALTGSAHVGSLSDGSARIALTQRDGPAAYTFDGRIDAKSIVAHLVAHEPQGGPIASVAKLPALGALAVEASVDGPRDALATNVRVSAGPLRATADGRVDLIHSAADLTVAASAPAMQPSPSIGWQSVALNATVKGPFSKPDANGTLLIEALHAAGAGAARVAADIQGNAGAVGLHATVTALTIPGPKPDLFAAAPLDIAAHVQLDQPSRPATFSLHHPLLDVTGAANTAGAQSVDARIVTPDIAPFAAIGGVTLAGRTDLMLHAAVDGKTTQASARGTIDVTGGQAPIPGLIGPATLDAAGSLTGPDIAIDHLTLNGATLRVGAHGGMASDTVNLDWRIALSDLAVVAPKLAGHLAAHGHVGGPTNDLAAVAELDGEVASSGVRSGPFSAHIDANGLPAAPSGNVTVQGAFDGSPIDVQASGARAADGALHVEIAKADWKSAAVTGKLEMAAGAKIPVGAIDLKLARLADFSALAGVPLTGAVQARLTSDANRARLDLAAHGAGSGASSVRSAILAATVADPATHPVVDATLALDGIAAGGIGGSAKVAVRGPQDALGVTLNAGLTNLQGANATVVSTAVVDARASTVRVSALTANWKGQTARLLAPVRVDYGGGLAVDRLRLGLQQAVLDVAGRITPTLALTASLRNVTADLARIAAPTLQADGTLSADAKLAGTLARPTGTVRVDARGLRMRSGSGSGLPAASVLATAQLAGDRARLDARVNAGPRLALTLAGTAPLAATGALDLRFGGNVDLAILDPVLGAAGERARGRVTLAAVITGTTADPSANGTLRLANGEVQDFAQGIHITDLNALIEGAGKTIKIARFTGRAGPGTIALAGSVGLGAGEPVDLTLTARNARPLSSDLATATLDADLTLRGELATKLAAAGTIAITRAEIRVPDKLPPSVPVLNVVNLPGKPPPAPAAGPAPTPLEIDLALGISANEVFVRGRGLDAELGGDLHLGGTAASPQPSGGFKMRRGTFSLAGQTLTFTRGEVGFDGGSLSDPSIDFVASSINNNVTANLEISGFASAPKIKLSSTPDLPQDEVLAHLLYGKSSAQLSPFQLAEIGAALASLTGAGGSGDPLNGIRSGLGLDRLSVGGDAAGNPSLQAGRYVAKGVYVGAQQGASSGSTQATVQVDLYKGLKLESTVGTGSTSATGSSNSGATATGGSSVGLTYQFEY